MPADRLLHPKSGHSYKVSMLTDLEFRVWVQYLLSADDFGVLLDTPAPIQADNRHLLHRKLKDVRRCLDALVACGLLHRFEHQGQAFLFSHNWQRWQKVEYPRATDMPKPDGPALNLCEDSTRALFEKHPGGQRKERRHAGDDLNHSGRASQIDPEGIPPTRAGAPAERLTANGIRLAAHGSEGEPGETAAPVDVWFARLKALYPPNRVTSGHRTMTAFVDALLGAPEGSEAAFGRMLSNLAIQQRGHQWRVKGMVPKLENWLREGAWEQQHEAAPVETLVNEKTAGTLAAAAAILRGEA